MERLFRHPWIIVCVVAAITVLFALQLPRARLDNNNFRFVPTNDPARVASRRIDETFGSQIIILVGLERGHGTVFDPAFLQAVRRYGEQVAAIPLVDKVSSIVNADYIGGSADRITVEPLVPDTFGGTSEEIALLRDRLLEWDLYRNGLVSDDFSSTQILVSLDVSAENAGSPEAAGAYAQMKRLAATAGFEDTRIHFAGLPALSAEINESVIADLRTLIPLVIVAVLVVLFLAFRSVEGMVLPLLSVAISTTWAIGAMALLGVRLSIISTVLPVILVAVGSAYGIHLVSHYHDETASKVAVSREEHRRLVLAVLRRVNRPVLLAALTTFAGFGSLCLTSVVPIVEFGIFSSFGVLIAYAVSVTLIPALFLIRGPAGGGAAAARPAASGEDRLSAALADGLLAVSQRRRSVLLSGAAAAVLSIAAISRIVIDNVMVEYFRADAAAVESEEFIRRRFAGSKSVSVVVSGEKPGDVLCPDVLVAMDGLAAHLAAHVPEVGKTIGFSDLVKRMNQVFNADESPEGLGSRPQAPAAGSGARSASAGAAATATAARAAAPAASGGEPAFGFGDVAADPSPAAESGAAEPAAGAPGAAQSADSDLRIVELLLRAAASSGRRAVSVDQLLAELARAVNYRGAAYYEIPADPARYGKEDAEGLKALIGNYLLLLSGDISSYADDPLEPRSIRLNVQLRTVGERDTDRALAAIRSYIGERFPPRLKVEIGGLALVEKSLNRLVIRSQLTSVASSLALVFLILAVYYRSAVAGLVGLAPLAVSILANFAVMGAFGIKLNIGTAMVAGVSVGIGIDYTIHYMDSYHRERLRAGSADGFLRRTFVTSGKAILFNAASVAAGFAVLAFSRFLMLAFFGTLIALTMATSALVSLTVLPALLRTVDPAFIRRPLPFERIGAETEELK